MCIAPWIDTEDPEKFEHGLGTSHGCWTPKLNPLFPTSAHEIKTMVRSSNLSKIQNLTRVQIIKTRCRLCLKAFHPNCIITWWSQVLLQSTIFFFLSTSSAEKKSEILWLKFGTTTSGRWKIALSDHFESEWKKSSLHSLHTSQESCQNNENTAWSWKLANNNWKVEFAGGLRTACLSRSSAGTPGPTQETLWGVLHLRCVLISTCCWWPPSWRGLHTQPSSTLNNYIHTAYLILIKQRNVAWYSRLTTLPD